MTRIDQLIKELWYCLPAATCVEIAKKLSLRMSERISVAEVNGALAHLRRHSDHYEWTVPHVSRGINADGEKRFIRVLTDRDGSFIVEGDTYAFVRNGAIATTAHITTMATNETAALLACSEHVRSTTVRRRLREVADDLGYVSRKAAALLTELREEAA